MYSTCLFCKSDLGANESIEHFPVGRRLAFDGAKGRLWVVCRKCERWNLTPLEERWEAIEECERSYRDTRLRVSTDNIGLARIGEGLELVRIGRPLRPEFAAWRYGDQFGKRRKRTMIQTGAAIVGVATIPFAGPLLGISLGGMGWNVYQAGSFIVNTYQGRKIAALVHTLDGRDLVIRKGHVAQTKMMRAEKGMPWGISVKHRKGREAGVPWWRYDPDDTTSELYGEDALRATTQLLPHINHKGASAKVVKDAVSLATAGDDAIAVFNRVLNMTATTSFFRRDDEGKLAGVPAEHRLALEMLTHEESERRALEGELEILEAAWKDAEEIAHISDNLFLPPEVDERIKEMKGRGA
jgi:hypothetical protein